MWMSKNWNRNTGDSRPEEATVTLEGTEREITGSIQTRNFVQYSPYGYQCGLPEGSDVLTVPVASGRAAVGVATPGEARALLPGEVRLTAASGAFIFLRRDGCAEINGLVITPQGILKEQGGAK